MLHFAGCLRDVMLGCINANNAIHGHTAGRADLRSSKINKTPDTSLYAYIPCLFIQLCETSRLWILNLIHNVHKFTQDFSWKSCR